MPTKKPVISTHLQYILIALGALLLFTCVRQLVAPIDQTELVGLARSNAPSAGQVLNGALGFIGGTFGTVLNLLLVLIISIHILLVAVSGEGSAILRGSARGEG